ncbi:hypothetical protein [Methylobacterium indicum]|nr:hypothetical protein [Methylobacterium indicum]
MRTVTGAAPLLPWWTGAEIRISRMAAPDPATAVMVPMVESPVEARMLL